jgi:hypothetical protein
MIRNEDNENRMKEWKYSVNLLHRCPYFSLEIEFQRSLISNHFHGIVHSFVIITAVQGVEFNEIKLREVRGFTDFWFVDFFPLNSPARPQPFQFGWICKLQWKGVLSFFSLSVDQNSRYRGFKKSENILSFHFCSSSVFSHFDLLFVSRDLLTNERLLIVGMTSI